MSFKGGGGGQNMDSFFFTIHILLDFYINNVKCHGFHCGTLKLLEGH